MVYWKLSLARYWYNRKRVGVPQRGRIETDGFLDFHRLEVEGTEEGTSFTDTRTINTPNRDGLHCRTGARDPSLETWSDGVLW